MPKFKHLSPAGDSSLPRSPLAVPSKSREGPDSPGVPAAAGEQRTSSVIQWARVLLYTYLLLLAVATIGAGFSILTGGREGAEKLFAFATNPIMGLLAGMLSTALVQSSSTVTSIIVGLCAGGLPVVSAIPMVMGANVGTTITNTLVSVGHLEDRGEFKRAFAAATVHDFFNLLCVALFLPLELAFGVLETLSLQLTLMIGSLGTSLPSFKALNPIKPLTQPVVDFAVSGLSGLPSTAVGLVTLAAGTGLIFGSILQIGRCLKGLMIGRAGHLLHSAVGRGPISGVLSGTLATILVQSSSTTTSLMVPLAGTGVLKLRQVYPFTLGANIGTCVTALLAAAAVTGPNAHFGLQIALAHLCFNLLGVLLVLGIGWLRELPPLAAEALAERAERHSMVAFAYVVIVFFVVPGICLALSSRQSLPGTRAPAVIVAGPAQAGGLLFLDAGQVD